MLLCLATGSQCEREPGDDRSRIRRQHAAQEQPGAGDHASTTTQPRPRQSISQPPGVMKRVVAEQERRVDHPMSAGSDPMPIHEPDVLDHG
ncbi:MAG: hypothetical protein WA746_28525 [Isosphaeraceae bacterium]